MSENRAPETGAEVPAVPGVDVKIYLPKDPEKDHGKLMGFASVSLGGVFAVNNIRIYNTENGPYAETAVTLDCGGASFMTKGRTVAAAGWKGTEKAFLSTLKQKAEEPAPSLPVLSDGQRLEGADALLKQGTTSPPARFTEDVCYKG